MKADEFKELFQTEFYSPTYRRWRIDTEKAGKDIVGEQYELFRKLYYEKMGFETKNGNKVLGSSYNCDVVVKKNNQIVILEEDKASYLDSCFLGRAIQNAAEVFDICLNQSITPPFFIISSSTKMSNYKNICDRRFKLYREDIQILLNSKFLYFPLCESNRISQKTYFKSEDSCFSLSDELINNQNKFIKAILNE